MLIKGFSSEQVATVLRGSQHNGSVRLIVARPIEPTSPDYQMISSTAPIIPTKMLTGDPGMKEVQNLVKIHEETEIDLKG